LTASAAITDGAGVVVSGSLANRLVAAASPDVWAVTEACTPEDVDGLVRKTVAVVLRELAESGALLEEFGGDMPAACLALAGVVEGGEPQ